MPVFFGNDCFLQQWRDLVQLGLHAPLVVGGEESMDHFSVPVGDHGGVLDLIRQRKDPVE